MPSKPKDWLATPNYAGAPDAYYGLCEAAGRNYYEWLAACFAPYFGATVLEHGAGTGLLSEAMREKGARKMVLTEPEPHLAELLRERFRDHPQVEVFVGTIEAYAGQPGAGLVDAIVSSNVLEHIPDDAACLRVMHDLLAPGGILGVYVPARPELYGAADEEVGHQRRYRRRELARKLTLAGFEIATIRYRNLIGVLPWWISGRLFRQRKLNTTSIKLFDSLVFPISRRLEDWVPPPYGLNLLAIARKAPSHLVDGTSGLGVAPRVGDEKP